MDDDAVHSSFACIIQQLSKPSDDYTLCIANRVYVHNKMTVNKSTAKLLRKYYRTELEKVDFATKAEKVQVLLFKYYHSEVIQTVSDLQNAINVWVAKQTHENIQNLIPGNILSEMTRMVLVNAVYFQGDWLDQFDVGATRKEIFHVRKGVDKEVELRLLTR